MSLLNPKLMKLCKKYREDDLLRLIITEVNITYSKGYDDGNLKTALQWRDALHDFRKNKTKNANEKRLINRAIQHIRYYINPTSHYYNKKEVKHLNGH